MEIDRHTYTHTHTHTRALAHLPTVNADRRNRIAAEDGTLRSAHSVQLRRIRQPRLRVHVVRDNKLGIDDVVKIRGDGKYVDRR